MVHSFSKNWTDTMARRVVALAIVSLAVAILAIDNWPTETRAALAAADTDLSNLPVMYD